VLVHLHATSQQLSGTAGLLDDPAAVPTSTKVHTTIALAPTSGDGRSSGIQPMKRGQAGLFDKTCLKMVLLRLSIYMRRASN
jgi:hypothetical protein